ncbi:unnamed protein product [Meloidogyne enterolobii]|uniref:Uncharacterized protein n=1 Tax=Meloidogyne enterolobii TaxID=390850 RepID=A0ACB1AWS6_MELEN
MLEYREEINKKEILENNGEDWFEILKNKGKEVLNKILNRVDNLNLNSFKELKKRLITTFQLRGILEIYKHLADKFNYFNENYENKIKKIIENLESFEGITENLNGNFVNNFNQEKIKELVKKYGNELIEEFIENKIKIEIINNSIEDNKKFKVDLNIEKVEDWIIKKMNEL